MNPPQTTHLFQIERPDGEVGPGEVRELVSRACPAESCREKRVLLIVPDGTRTAPIGVVFKALFEELGAAAQRLDVLIALGTHQPMTEAAICKRLEISVEERRAVYGRVEFFNHNWNDPAELKRVGVIQANEIEALSGGLFSMDVNVEINRRIFDYDQLLIIGPVFPHEVVGFSGGNKYLFPGISGPEILNFFHWLGAVVSNPKIIGNKWTPVRRVVDKAGSMVPIPKLCFCLVVENGGLAGLFAGSPEAAWDAASNLSDRLHVIYKERPFHTILSCAPRMYDELWTGGKCMYKLEPVLADGGELIIYAPHISEVCVTHGAVLHQVGYHCRDFFVKQWDRYRHHPWGVLAHSCHVYGQGTFANGVETPRAKVTLATAIPKSVCDQINLGYCDPKTIDIEEFANRESEGILLVRKAGEMLYKLRNPPGWARCEPS